MDACRRQPGAPSHWAPFPAQLIHCSVRFGSWQRRWSLRRRPRALRTSSSGSSNCRSCSAT
eukprot:4690434-Prymnesium_polylepis.2